MSAGGAAERPSFQRIDVAELSRRLAQEPRPLVLDVRREAAFAQLPGVPGALPLAIDREPLQLPDVDHGRPIVTYCL